MPISSPTEPVYYYECSGREFRLVYFMPPEMLEQLSEQGQIRPDILEDYPDGVDLVCTSPDFAEFHQEYGYRPEYPADALRRAFFAIYSSTSNWETFRGSGMIPARDLESRVEDLERSLRQDLEFPDEPGAATGTRTLEGRQNTMSPRAIQSSPGYAFLEQLQVEGIDPGRTLREQRFSPIEKSDGEAPEEVFSKLQLKRKSE